MYGRDKLSVHNLEKSLASLFNAIIIRLNIRDTQTSHNKK